MNKEYEIVKSIDSTGWEKYYNTSETTATFVFDHKSLKFFIYIKIV